MIVLLISAIDGNKVFFRVGNGVENKRVARHVEAGNPRKALIDIIDDRRVGVVRRNRRDRRHAHDVGSRFRGGEIVRITCCLADIPAFKLLFGAVFRDKSKLKRIGGRSGICPADSGILYRNNGHGKLVPRIFRQPFGVQRKIFLKHRVRVTGIRKLIGIVVGAYPPTAEIVAFPLGRRNVIQFSADRSDRRDRLRALVIEIKADLIFRLAGHRRRPTRINFRILRNGFGLEIVQLLIFRIRIPAEENISFTDGIGRLCNRFSVHDGNVGKRTPPHARFKGDGVHDLFQKSALGFLICNGKRIIGELCIKNCSFVLTVLFRFGNVERNRRALHGISPHNGELRCGKDRLISLIE